MDSIKWFKGNTEFLRYTPKEIPAFSDFPGSSVKVDLSATTPHQLVLRDVRPAATGLYSCGVTTTSDTQGASSFLNVVDVPKEDPILNIGKTKIENGYKIKARCEAPLSQPRMNISWYIDNINTNETYQDIISPDQHADDDDDALITASYIVKEIDGRNHPKDVKVQCIATLFDLYQRERVFSCVKFRCNGSSNLDRTSSIAPQRFYLETSKENKNNLGCIHFITKQKQKI